MAASKTDEAKSLSHPDSAHEGQQTGDSGIGDLSRDNLVASFLPYVQRMAAQMAGWLPPELSVDDLVSAGITAVNQAVERFDSSRGYSLRTYALLGARGAMVDQIREMDWTPRSVRRAAREFNAVRDRLAQDLGRPATAEELAEALQVSPDRVTTLMEDLRERRRVSLQDPINPAPRDEEPLREEEVLVDPAASGADEEAMRAEDRSLLFKELQRLPMQQQQVLVLYYMEDLKLGDIAEILDVTESRVSQIHTQALAQLRGSFVEARIDTSQSWSAPEPPLSVPKRMPTLPDPSKKSDPLLDFLKRHSNNRSAASDHSTKVAKMSEEEYRAHLLAVDYL